MSHRKKKGRPDNTRLKATDKLSDRVKYIRASDRFRD